MHRQRTKDDALCKRTLTPKVWFGVSGVTASDTPVTCAHGPDCGNEGSERETIPFGTTVETYEW